MSVAATTVAADQALSQDAPSEAAKHRSMISERTLGGAIKGSPKANCTCRYKGEDVFLGQSICMKTPKGYVQAQCTRYLNNTSWTITKTPCEIS